MRRTLTSPQPTMRASNRRRRSHRSQRCRSPARSATCASLTASPTSARLLICAASRASGGWPFSAARHSVRRQHLPGVSRHLREGIWDGQTSERARAPWLFGLTAKLTADSPLHKDPVVDHEAPHDVPRSRLRPRVPIQGGLELIDLLAIEPALLDANALPALNLSRTVLNDRVGFTLNEFTEPLKDIDAVRH